MENPTGESVDGPLRLDFDRRLTLQCRGSVVTSDAGLLAYRELDDAFGPSVMAGGTLADARTGRNGRRAVTSRARWRRPSIAKFAPDGHSLLYCDSLGDTFADQSGNSTLPSRLRLCDRHDQRAVLPGGERFSGFAARRTRRFRLQDQPGRQVVQLFHLAWGKSERRGQRHRRRAGRRCLRDGPHRSYRHCAEHARKGRDQINKPSGSKPVTMRPVAVLLCKTAVTPIPARAEPASKPIAEHPLRCRKATFEDRTRQGADS